MESKPALTWDERDDVFAELILHIKDFDHGEMNALMRCNCQFPNIDWMDRICRVCLRPERRKTIIAILPT